MRTHARLLNRDSPDESQTGINVRVLPTLLQDRRPRPLAGLGKKVNGICHRARSIIVRQGAVFLGLQRGQLDGAR